MLNTRSKICLLISILIMVVFFSVQSSVIFKYSEPSYSISLFEYFCVLAFMPFFFVAVIDFVKKSQDKDQEIDDKLKAIDISNIVLEYDLTGKIVAVNGLFCNLLGYSKEEVLGFDLIDFVDPKDWTQEEYKIFWWNRSTRGVTRQGEFKFLTKEGAVVWLYGNFNPIKNQYGEVYKTIQIVTDITEKKIGEEEINRKNGYLEYASKILRHDMHSGINTYIPRGVNSLERRITPQDIENLKIGAPLKMIKEGLAHTQKVYKGVYEFTNLVRKDTVLNKENHNLKTILDDYLSNTSYVKQVIVNPLPNVDVNQALFCTAVDNLIRNGLKYNDSDTKLVEISMEGEDTFVIQDNGRGMTQKEFEELSKPYTRKEGQKEKGTGLGLNICVAILKEHGFEITSEKNEIGTKINIKITQKP